MLSEALIEYGSPTTISNIAGSLFMPNPTLSPLGFATWDLLIVIHTFQPTIAQRFILYSSKLYSRKSYWYAVIEGKPLDSPIYRYMHGKIVVPSKFCRQHIESIGVKVEKVIPHGIIHREFSQPPDETKTIKDMFKGHKILLYIGNSDYRKALPQLIESLGILNKIRQDWILIMHVDGKRKLELIQQAHKNAILNKIYFTSDILGCEFGTATRKIITTLYHACDLHLLPSYCEGFGIPLIEAGACHKTSVCINAPPMNEVVNRECAYLVKYERVEWKHVYPTIIYQSHIWNSKEYAETIDYALSNQKITEEKAEKNFQNSLKYDYKTVYKEFLDLP